MTTEMYGTPFGSQSYYKDQDQRMLNQSLARVHNANAAKAERELEKEAAMMAALGQGDQQPSVGVMGEGGTTAGTPTFEDLADQLRQRSQKLLQLGMVREAGDAAKDAATTLQSVQTAATSQATQRLQELRGQEKMLDEIHNMTAGVNSPQDLLNAQQIWMERHPNEQLPIEFRRYDPNVFSQLRMMSEQGREAIRLQISEEEAASKQADRESNAAFRQFRKGYMSDVTELRRAREERLAKEGATKVSGPTDSEVEAARLMLGQKYKNFREGDKGIAARDIAARAKRIWKSNPKMDSSTAIARVIAKMEQDGELSVVTPKVFGVPAVNPETRYKDAGKLPTAPIELTTKAATDRKTMVEGNYYRTSKGLFQWKGGKPVQVRPQSAVPANNYLDEEEDDLTGEEEN